MANNTIKRISKTTLNLIRYIISACLVVLIFGFSYQILTETYKNKEVEDDGSSFHNLPPNSLDVLVLGSSHAQYSFCPAFFYEDTGLYSYVLGSGGQPLEMSYEMLKEGLKTQSPKLVILEVFTALPLRSNAEADYNYITPEYQMTGKEKYNAINYLPEDKRKQYLNDFITTHNDWKDDGLNFDNLKIAFNKVKNDLTNTKTYDYEKIDKDMGFVINYPVYPVDNFWFPYNTHNYLDVTLDELDQKSLNNIYDLCQEKGIELLLYKTPIDSLDQENISYLHKVWEWADERNVKYVDFIELSPKLDFNLWLHSDSFHCYMNGASIITAYLADTVNQNNYDFNRLDNEILTSINRITSSHITSEYLKYENNPLKYYVRMRNYSNLLLIKYNAGNVTESTRQFLEKYDIDPNNNFYGLFDNGELIESSDTELMIDYNGHSYVVNSDGVLVDWEVFDDKGGELDFVIYDKKEYMHQVKSTDVKDVWGWKEPFYGRY